MSLLDFRNAFITRLNSRLAAINCATASDNDLLLAGAMFKQLDAVNKIDPITIDALRIIENMSAAELDAYALDPSSRMHVQNIIKDSAAMPALVQSTAAINAIAGSAEWIKLIAADAGGLSVVVGSTTAMNAIAANATARNTIGTGTGTFITAIKSSNMAIAKLLAGYAGVTPADYADMTVLAASNAAMNAVAANATARNLIGNAGTAFDQVKVSPVAMAKMLAALCALVPANYADTTAFAASTPAMTALAASTDGLNFLALSTTAIATLFNNNNARATLWASDTAAGVLLNNTTSRTYLTSLCSQITFYPFSNTNQLAKKVWLLRVYAIYTSTAGNMSWSYCAAGSSFNSVTGNTTPYYKSTNPFDIAATQAKASALTLSSTLSGAAPDGAQYFYLQMEA
ncbi:hypothetical protein ACO0LB_06245 [Undibacterium sp. SXout7W]|uniref:hypothetical protein n=1 Tax=Undibacterium sp. SXout7W TaxID=3413049 RepID=UPI003BF326D1